MKTYTQPPLLPSPPTLPTFTTTVLTDNLPADLTTALTRFQARYPNRHPQTIRVHPTRLNELTQAAASHPALNQTPVLPMGGPLAWEIWMEV